MTAYDFNRPFIGREAMSHYIAIDPSIAKRYGKHVKAVALANVEYKVRYEKAPEKERMQPPPSCGRIFSGYLVVRRLGQPREYETWMPGMHLTNYIGWCRKERGRWKFFEGVYAR